MDTTKAEVVESGVSSSPAPRSFRSRLLAHYKRWWWVHVIVWIVVVLVVILPIIYVGYPRIAQRDVNESTLRITRMIISNPTPDSLLLNQTQMIGSHSHFHPEIYSFEAAVTLGGAATPFVKVHVPTFQSIDGGKVSVSQTLDLHNSSSFSDYATAIMTSKEISLNIFGRPVLQEGALPKTRVTYNKTVTMKGLNKLRGFSLTDFQILTAASANKPNMKGMVYIPNPSVMTIEMGNITLDLSIAGTPVGQAFLENFTLKPGNNTLPITAKVDETAIVNLYMTKTVLFANGMVPLTVSGNSSVYDGQNIPYFTRALAANTFTVDLNLGSALSQIGLDMLGPF